MKLTTNATVEIPVARGNFRTLQPDTYFAIVEKVDAKINRGKAYDLETKSYVKNPNDKEDKWDYLSIIPTLQVLTSDGTVEMSMERYTVGNLENGAIISPSAKYGSGKGSAIWFGLGGAGYLLVALGLINDAGEMSDFDTDAIFDRVVKIKTAVGAYIPVLNKEFKPYELTNILKKINDGQEYEFEDVDHLILRYNLVNEYTQVVIADGGGVLYAKDSADEITREVYAGLMKRFASDEIKFVDIHDKSTDSKSVRLKAKTVIVNFYAPTEREADSNGWYYHAENQVYVTKASQTSAATEGEEDGLVGW